MIALIEKYANRFLGISALYLAVDGTLFTLIDKFLLVANFILTNDIVLFEPPPWYPLLFML